MPTATQLNFVVFLVLVMVLLLENQLKGVMLAHD